MSTVFIYLQHLITTPGVIHLFFQSVHITGGSLLLLSTSGPPDFAVTGSELVLLG